MKKILNRAKLVIMSVLTYIAIKCLNDYLMKFYFDEFEKYHKQDYTELIEYIREKLTDGSEVNVILNQEMAEGTFGLTFDGEDEDELEEYDEKKLH